MDEQLTAAKATIEYGRAPARRWRRVAWIAALAAAAILLAWAADRKLALRARVIDAYTAWRYARLFDESFATLTSDADGVWLPTSEADRDTADAALRDFFAKTAVAGGFQIQGYHRGPANRLLFVRRGDGPKGRWIVFACASATGLEAFVLSRDDRSASRYDRLLQTPQFRSTGFDGSSFDCVVRGAKSSPGGAVEVTLVYEGSPNEIEWSFAPAAAPLIPVGPFGRAASAPIANVVKPHTGWTDAYGNWWPETNGVALIDGPAPPVQLVAEPGALGIAFMPDGRIALPTTKRFLRLDPSRPDAPPAASPLPKLTRPPEWAVFSPDGRTGFLAGSEQMWLLDTTNGDLRPIGETIGLSRPSLGDGKTFWLLDNTTWREFDRATGVVRRTFPEDAFYGSRVDGLTARKQAGSNDVTVTDDATGRVLCTVTPDAASHAISLSPGGRRLAIRGQSGLLVVDARTGARLFAHAGNSDLHAARSPIHWTPDGRFGAAAGLRYVYVWSNDPPIWAARFPQKGWPMPDVAISADGRRLAASADDAKTVAYWPDLAATTRPAETDAE